MTAYSGLVLLAYLVLLAAGCSSTGQRTAIDTLPDTNHTGAQTYINRCSTCHSPPHPARHDYAGWQHLLSLMERRMVERGVPPLSDTERSYILAYLKDNAR